MGCGRGAVLFAAADAVRRDGRVVGIDLSPRMAELTSADAAARGLTQVSVVQGDAERPDFAARLIRRGARRIGDLLPARRRGGAAGVCGACSPRAAGSGSPRSLRMTRCSTRPCARPDRSYPDALPDRGDRQGPFGSVTGITEVLGATGFADVRIDERIYESRFTDADHWLAWVWSHGGRATLERVPPGKLADAVAAAKTEFAAARTPRGDYALHTTIRFTTARPT